MWDEMREEMAALVDDKTQKELGREELLNWMGQVPSVLQDILPKPSGTLPRVFFKSITLITQHAMLCL